MLIVISLGSFIIYEMATADLLSRITLFELTITSHLLTTVLSFVLNLFQYNSIIHNLPMQNIMLLKFVFSIYSDTFLLT